MIQRARRRLHLQLEMLRRKCLRHPKSRTQNLQTAEAVNDAVRHASIRSIELIYCMRYYWTLNSPDFVPVPVRTVAMRRHGVCVWFSRFCRFCLSRMLYSMSMCVFFATYIIIVDSRSIFPFPDCEVSHYIRLSLAAMQRRPQLLLFYRC